MLINPFKQIDEMIKRDYKIPIFPPAKAGILNQESFIETMNNNTVNLSELLEVVRSHCLNLQKENFQLNADLKEVLTSGAIRYFCDDYYSNFDAVQKSREIYKRRYDKNETQN